MPTPSRMNPAARRLSGRGLFVELAAAAVVRPDARAQASVPYTPSVAARRAIQVLVDDAALVPAGATSPSGLRVRVDDSAAVAESGGVRVQAWSRRSWWGPGWQDSRVLGHNAPALVGLGMQRAGGACLRRPG